MHGLAGLRPSAGTGRTAWSLSRAVVLCAVLGGLFLMHGLSIQDCHDPAPTSSATQAATGEHAAMSDPMPMAASMPMAGQAPGSVGVHQPAMGLGASCVSTLPTRQSAGLVTLLLICGVLLGGLAWSVGVRAGSSRRRAPPRPGRALLTTLCVSRT